MLNLIEFQSTSLLSAGILALIVILVFYVHQLQRDNIKIKRVLNEKGLLKEEEGYFETFIGKMKSKTGYVDARILWIFIALILVYLLWKAGKLPF